MLDETSCVGGERKHDFDGFCVSAARQISEGFSRLKLASFENGVWMFD